MKLENDRWHRRVKRLGLSSGDGATISILLSLFLSRESIAVHMWPEFVCVRRAGNSWQAEPAKSSFKSQLRPIKCDRLLEQQQDERACKLQQAARPGSSLAN